MEGVISELGDLEESGNQSASVIYYVRALYSMCVIEKNTSSVGAYTREVLYARHNVSSDKALRAIFIRCIQKFGKYTMGIKFTRMNLCAENILSGVSNDPGVLYRIITEFIQLYISVPDISAMIVRVYPLILIALSDRVHVTLPYRQIIIDSVMAEFLDVPGGVSTLTPMQLAYIVMIGFIQRTVSSIPETLRARLFEFAVRRDLPGFC